MKYRSLTKLVSTVVLAVFVEVAGANGAFFPEIIALPDGFQPEGVARGYGPELFAGSLENGSIVAVDLRTGSVQLAVPPSPGRTAVGLAFDARTDLVFVAGGASGEGYVYDPASGEDVAEYEFASGMTFVNDVVVTRNAAYFTDSFQPYIYRVPLGPGGYLPEASDVETIALTGDFEFSAGAFNANGIEASPSGRWLLLVHSDLGILYRVDPKTGDAVAVDLGGALLSNGDGLALAGRTLYVVQNRLNQIAVVEMAPDFASGTVVSTITSAAFDVPTTVAVFDGSLYAVNARFGTPPGPVTPYQIVAVPRH